MQKIDNDIRLYHDEDITKLSEIIDQHYGESKADFKSISIALSK